jgi:hypothetical protein
MEYRRPFGASPALDWSRRWSTWRASRQTEPGATQPGQAAATGHSSGATRAGVG